MSSKVAEAEASFRKVLPGLYKFFEIDPGDDPEDVLKIVRPLFNCQVITVVRKYGEAAALAALNNIRNEMH